MPDKDVISIIKGAFMIDFKNNSKSIEFKQTLHH